MADGTKKDWRELCLAVTNERDSTKLSSLVEKLIEALDKSERSWRPNSCPQRRIGRKGELGEYA
jgi:hypothetical protein